MSTSLKDAYICYTSHKDVFRFLNLGWTLNVEPCSRNVEISGGGESTPRQMGPFAAVVDRELTLFFLVVGLVNVHLKFVICTAVLVKEQHLEDAALGC